MYEFLLTVALGKSSGFGRESGPEGLKEYLQPKTIHINMNVPTKGK